MAEAQVVYLRQTKALNSDGRPCYVGYDTLDKAIADHKETLGDMVYKASVVVKGKLESKLVSAAETVPA